MRQTRLIANHALAKQLRSWQFLLALLPAIAVITFLFKDRYKADVDFYGTMIGGYLIAQTVLTTSLVFRAAAQHTAYPVIARLRTRTPYLLGNLLAAMLPIWLLWGGITCYLLGFQYLALVRPRGLDVALVQMQSALGSLGQTLGLGWCSVLVLLLAGLAMLLACAVVATLTTLVMPLVSPRWLLLLLVSLVAFSLYSFSPDMPASLKVVGQPFGALLFPILVLYDLCRTAHFQPWTGIAVAAALTYVVGGLALARYLFARRDLLLG